MEVLQIALTLAILLVLVVPVGKYIYKIISGEKSFVDPCMDRVDGFIFKISGIKKDSMNWKQYSVALLLTNLIMTLMVFVILLIQGLNLLNPNGIKGMDLSLAFNTAISFITNTNLQHYSGEAGLSYLSQMAAITFLMFTSAASGFSAAAAFIRGITGSEKGLGNFYVDFVRLTTRILLALSIITSIALIWQGVPQTLSSNETIKTIEGTLQNIALGPVASLESIKHIGTNGGGFFGANAAHPFENPTPITNLIHILSMMILPSSLVYSFGLMLKNKKQAWVIFGAMALLFMIALPTIFLSESAGNPALDNAGLSQAAGNMEGKEVRFGIAQSSLFTTVTTAFTTGSVNTMHDSLTPIGGMIAMGQMMLNVVFGGKGVGLMNMLMYAILTVFLCGLMVGRTPEFLGKKIEGREIKLIAIAILVHPFIILLPSAISLVAPAGVAGITNPGFHGISQVLYEFTSSAANNGSGFEGLLDNSVFWNVSTGLVMLLGRYTSIVALLAVAGSMQNKKAVPVTVGTLKTDTYLFTFVLVAVVLIVGALTFFPSVALGPISEYLTQLT